MIDTQSQDGQKMQVNSATEDTGGYAFTVTGIDTMGGGGLIRFQIENGSTLVYDNQFDVPITDNPTISASGGKCYYLNG